MPASPERAALNRDMPSPGGFSPAPRLVRTSSARLFTSGGLSSPCTRRWAAGALGTALVVSLVALVLLACVFGGLPLPGGRRAGSTHHPSVPEQAEEVPAPATTPQAQQAAPLLRGDHRTTPPPATTGTTTAASGAAVEAELERLRLERDKLAEEKAALQSQAAGTRREEARNQSRSEEQKEDKESQDPTGSRDQCSGGSRNACRCLLSCDPTFGGDVGRCEGPAGKEEDQRRQEMLNRLIGVTLRSTLDACGAMTCIVKCARQLRCFDQKVKDDCESMREQRGQQNCRLECEDDDNDHEDDDDDVDVGGPVAEAIRNLPGAAVPASSDSDEHGQGTLELLRQQLQAAGNSSLTPVSQPREQHTFARATLDRATIKL